jgi:hypothetical protein
MMQVSIPNDSDVLEHFEARTRVYTCMMEVKIHPFSTNRLASKEALSRLQTEIGPFYRVICDLG